MVIEPTSFELSSRCKFIYRRHFRQNYALASRRADAALFFLSFIFQGSTVRSALRLTVFESSRFRRTLSRAAATLSRTPCRAAAPSLKTAGHWCFLLLSILRVSFATFRGQPLFSLYALVDGSPCHMFHIFNYFAELLIPPHWNNTTLIFIYAYLYTVLIFILEDKLLIFFATYIDDCDNAAPISPSAILFKFVYSLLHAELDSIRSFAAGLFAFRRATYKL